MTYENIEMEQEIIQLLSQPKKSLPSKYFYDKKGDALFQSIMEMPEYYLTRSEFEIFQNQSNAIFSAFNPNGHFEILELGAGDGAKTKVLLGHWLKKTSAFNYIPIDISQNVLDILGKSFKTELPKLNISPLQGDYFRALAQTKTSKNRRLVLFLGSNIGNFRKNNESIFIQAISEQLKPNDAVLIGFDLAKDPRVIRSAYNDKAGITKAFNLNLLQRCNRELNTNFAIEEFDHYPIYDPLTREARSYLVSNIAQKVSFPNSGKTIDIAKGEIIHTETSRKYTHEEINQLFTENGFNVERSFEDCKGYFADVLAVKK